MVRVVDHKWESALLGYILQFCLITNTYHVYHQKNWKFFISLWWKLLVEGVWGDHYEEDPTQGSERQENEVSYPLWKSCSQSSGGETVTWSRNWCPKGAPWWQCGSSLGSHRKEMTPPPFPCHPPSDLHMPEICLYAETLCQAPFPHTSQKRKGVLNLHT